MYRVLFLKIFNKLLERQNMHVYTHNHLPIGELVSKNGEK